MAKNKYKIEITKAYLIAIVDKDGNEIDSDWSFLNYNETKKQAEKMLERYKRLEELDLEVMADGSLQVTNPDTGETYYRKHEENGDIWIREFGSTTWVHIGNLYDLR